MNDYLKEIIEQEKRDRFVTTKCLEKLLSKGSNLQINVTKLKDHVDLKCSVDNTNRKTFYFNVEIKERNKNEYQLQQYPHAELKLEKYNLMRQETPQSTALLYFVILNQSTGYLFNLTKIDWNKVKHANWRVKRTQMKPNSQYETVPIYQIPFELACKKIDCKEYFDEYYRLEENNKSKLIA